MTDPPTVPAVRAWRPRVPAIREILHARFTDHAYPPHTHDTWTLFIVDDGAVGYDLARRPRVADRSMVTILPPHVVHDGRPATGGGYTKRVLYLEPSALDERLVGPAVDRPVMPDARLRARLVALHEALACPGDALEAETRLGFILERIAASLAGVPGSRTVVGDEPDGPPDRPSAEAERLRAYLDEHLQENVTLAAASLQIGLPVTRLARSFSSVFGIPPHGYVLGRRLDAARDRILGGQPLADVAAEVGFCDQAHLTRRFRRFLGIAPGTFRARARGHRSRKAALA